MTEQLSWPIESVAPQRDGFALVRFKVPFHGTVEQLYATTEQLAAAGIPAQPYPTPPVTITITVGERSEVVKLTDDEAKWMVRWAAPIARKNGVATDGIYDIGDALRRLGVQP